MTDPAEPDFIRHPLLDRLGVEHGFGVRGAPEPRGLVRPHQVHGVVVADALSGGGLSPGEADAIVSTQPNVPVGVVTADCVPILVATAEGSAVAAIHAGWRGLAAGVVEAAIERLRLRAGHGTPLVAVVGPRIGACCYEVDGPVLNALRRRFGGGVESATSPTRPDHARLDLGALTGQALAAAGIAERHVDVMTGVCTFCDADLFHSYRRDAGRAGRLLHHIAVGSVLGAARSEA